MKVRLREIRVFELNTRTVILLTHFVRIARVRESAQLRMEQSDIVYRVFKYAAKTENPDLIVLLMHIKRAMKKHIKECNLQSPSFNLYDDAAA